MSDYEPGQVAVATVRGVEGVRVLRTDGIGGADIIWLSSVFFRGSRHHQAKDVTDARPLVVLDLDAPSLDGNYGARLINLVEHLRRGTAISRHLADQIEAQTKPPRIPEPGLWGVVEAKVGVSEKRLWVHAPHGWVDPNDTGYPRSWGSLIDPTLIREGVES